MIVLHAIALAGGLDRGEGNLSGMVEGAREMERQRSMTLQVKQLLARRARLEAERDGSFTLPIPIQLAKLVWDAAGERTAHTFPATESTILRADQARRRQQGKETALRFAATRNEVEALLATESTVLRADQARRRQQDKEIALKVAAARNEVEALKRKLEQVDVQRDMRIERLNDMQKLKDRGWVTSNNVVALRTELSDIEAHRQDYLVAIVQAEARLAEAEEASPRLSSEKTANLANAIATVDKEIAAAQEAMISARTLATILYRPHGSTQHAEAYEIVRQSKDGARTLQATETSPLMPGDVLKVNLNVGTINPSSIAPARQSEPALPYIHTSNEN
jgi:hypothetical protein